MTQVGSTARRLSTPRPAQIAQSSMSDPEHVESVASPRPRSSHLVVDESSQGRPRRREGVGRNPGQPESVGRGRAPTVRPRCQQSGRGLHGRPACRRTDQQPTRAKSQAAWRNPVVYGDRGPRMCESVDNSSYSRFERVVARRPRDAYLLPSAP